MLEINIYLFNIFAKHTHLYIAIASGAWDTANPLQQDTESHAASQL